MTQKPTNMPSFTVALPDGWEDQTIYMFKGPDDSGLQHVVTLVIDPSPGTDDVAEYARERIDAHLNSMPSPDILKDEAKELPGGAPAYECVYKWMPTDGAPRYVKLVFVMIDGRGYTFSGTFSRKTIKTIALEMDQIVSNFTPLPTK